MDPILGSIVYTFWHWQMQGYMPCRGQSLPINQYQALYALLGTRFGGDGQHTFMLPDLRPWDIDAPDTGKRIKREWHDDEMVPHMATVGIFPSREY